MKSEHSDFVSVLTADFPQTKKYIQGKKEKTKFAYFWDNSEEPIADLAELYQLLRDLEGQRNSVIIRGRWIGKAQERQRHRRQGANYQDAPHHWFCVDVDDIPLGVIGSEDYAAQHKEIIKKLPFLGGSPCVFQFSGSAGLPGVKTIKAHLWFWNAQKIGSEDLKRVFTSHAESVDTALFNPVQIHYSAGPILEHTPCEIQSRTHLIPGDHELVLRVPDLKGPRIQTAGGWDLSKGTKALVAEIGPGNHNKGIYKAFLSAEIRGEDAEPIFQELVRRNIPHYGEARLREQWRRAREWANREFLSPLHTDGHGVTHLKQRYLDIEVPATGVVFVRSPQGTGKTRLLGRLEKRRLLVIGHSVPLLRQAAERLGLVLYLDTENPSLEDRLAITYNSLWKLCAEDGVAPFDTVVIDESDQFAHYSATAEIVKDRQVQEAFFEYLLTSANRIICMDADLSDLSVSMIERYRKERFSFYLNDYPVIDEVTFLRSAAEARGEVSRLLMADQRVLVPHESKADCKALHDELRARFPSKKGLCLHTDNAERYAEFFRRPNQFLRDKGIDWLVCSPVIRTGVSFEGVFDYVVGIFNSPNLVFDGPTIVQALMRERLPKGIMACVSYHRIGFSDTAFDKAWDGKAARIDPETGQLVLSSVDRRAIEARRAERKSKAMRHNHVRAILNERGGDVSTKKFLSSRARKHSLHEENASEKRMCRRLSRLPMSLTFGRQQAPKESGIKSKTFWVRTRSMKPTSNASTTACS